MKILIADDHALFREAMRHVLARLHEDIDLLEAGNCAQLLCAVEAHTIESKSNAAIAAELGLSRATIKAHMTAAFKTLGASNRAEAALMVKRLGLIPTHKKTGKDPERGS